METSKRKGRPKTGRYGPIVGADVCQFVILLEKYRAADIARSFNIKPHLMHRLEADVLKLRMKTLKDEKADFNRMLVPIKTGCFFENGYTYESLKGWERSVYIKGPEHSLFKREKGL